MKGSWLWRCGAAATMLTACALHPVQQQPVGGRPPLLGSPVTPEPVGTFERHGDIGTYVSIPWGFSTSSYVLEGPDGLIAIDTQFLPSAAEEMIRFAETATQKKVLLAIVLHPNPDKFNGTATFQRHGAKVVTSAQVKALMQGVHEKRLRAFYERYAPDYPRELPDPKVFGATTVELTAAGLTLKLHVMGAGCSEAHVVVEHQGRLFAGDLVAQKAHAWLEIGKTDEWLKRLDELRKSAPKRIYPGRGRPGESALLAEQAAYLRTVIDLVAAEKPSMPVRSDALDRIEHALVQKYPAYDFPVFLKIGLPAEWERQASVQGK